MPEGEVFHTSPIPCGAKRIVLCLSTGRTATNALANYFLEAFPGEVTATHEPSPSRFLRMASNMRFAGLLGPKSLARLIHLGYTRRLKRIATPYYLEANPFLFGYVDLLKDLFPDAQLVHLVRHPASYIVSHLDYGGHNIIKRHFPYWATKPEWEKGSGARWADMEPMERFAYRWSRINRELDRCQEFFGDRYHLVRYEDLFKNDFQGLRKIAECLEVPFSGRLAELTQRPRNTSEGGDKEKKKERLRQCDSVIAKWCAPLMPKYGYPLPAMEPTVA